MPVTIDGSNGITTPTYGGADTSEYLVPVTQFKNRIINGAMMIDQRNAGASVAANDGYTLDRWAMYHNSGSGSKGNVQQNQGSVTPPVGFSNYIGFTTTSAYSVGSTDGYAFQQRIEGYNVSDLGWGTASAATVTISFWVRSSLTGTFGGALRNSAGNRSYPFTYTISSANTWEQKSVTIAGDTTGTWATNNTAGIYVSFSIGAGSGISGTAGSWAAANYLSATGATSVVGTNGATFYITGVQLEKGSTATSFDYRPYGTELQLCQRYYYRVTNTAAAYGPLTQYGLAYSSTDTYCPVIFPQQMRGTPTLSSSNIRLSNPLEGFLSISSVSIQDASNNGCNIQASGSGFTSLRGYNIVPSTSSGFIAFSAEL